MNAAPVADPAPPPAAASQWGLLQADVRRNLRDYEPCSGLRRLALCLTLNSIHALVLLRLQLWCAAHGLPGIFFSKPLFWFFGIEVANSARIGPGLRLPHPMGIIIAPNTTIGANCDLYADTRLVLGHGSKRGPTLGDGVFLGDGAKVVGGVTVGAGTVVGVSSVVTKDLPADVTAVGIPARVIRQGRPELSPEA
ncbi:MAG: serine acetyltransferase [Verrucomicrobia bacterium]|nr:serine acetyltransferase [Verrucomicrobiota bacterium]